MTTIAQGIEQVNQMLDTVYGVAGGFERSPEYAIAWSIDKFEDTELAKKVLHRINRRRYQLGLVGVYFDYGHRFF